MTLRLELPPEAFAHVAEAFSWYQQRRSDLGWEFADALGAVLGLLREAPELGPVVYRGLRRALVRRFPYAVYYRIEVDAWWSWRSCIRGGVRAVGGHSREV